MAATTNWKRLAKCHWLAPWRFTWLLAWLRGIRLLATSVKLPRDEPVASLPLDSAFCSTERETSTGQARGILSRLRGKRGKKKGDVLKR